MTEAGHLEDVSCSVMPLSGVAGARATGCPSWHQQGGFLILCLGTPGGADGIWRSRGASTPQIVDNTPMLHADNPSKPYPAPSLKFSRSAPAALRNPF